MDDIAFARHLRENMSAAERRLWSIVRGRRLGAKFRRQVVRGPYFLDFACLERRLVVEVDGPHHVDMAAQDALRDAWLANHGFRVLRFWHLEVLRNPSGVHHAIAEALAGRP